MKIKTMKKGGSYKEIKEEFIQSRFCTKCNNNNDNKCEECEKEDKQMLELGCNLMHLMRFGTIWKPFGTI